MLIRILVFTLEEKQTSAKTKKSVTGFTSLLFSTHCFSILFLQIFTTGSFLGSLFAHTFTTGSFWDLCHQIFSDPDPDSLRRLSIPPPDGPVVADADDGRSVATHSRLADYGGALGMRQDVEPAQVRVGHGQVPDVSFADL